MKFKTTARILGTVTLLLAVMCRFVPYSSSTPPIEQLGMHAGEISNWRPEADQQIFIGSELFGKIDGGAPQYVNKGVIKTGWQRIDGPNSAMVETYVMDFGSEANARAMLEEKRTQSSGSTVSDPKYPVADVFVTPTLGGVTGFACHLNYYFEIYVTGYSYQEDALKTMNQFLALYIEKIESQ